MVTEMKYHASVVVWLLFFCALIWKVKSDDSYMSISSPGITTAMAITPDGSKLVVGANGMIKVYDTDEGNQLMRLTGFNNEVSFIVISPDGSKFVPITNTYYENVIRVYSLTDGGLIHSIYGHYGKVNSVVFTPDGSKIISGGSDATVQVWDMNEKDFIFSYYGHTGSVTSVAVTPDGSKIVSAQYYLIKIWKLSDGTLIRDISSSVGYIFKVAIISGGSQIISGDTWDVIYIRDVSSGNLVSTINAYMGYYPNFIITPDESKIITSGSYDYSIKVFSIKDGNLVFSLSGHTGYVRGISITPDGFKLFSGGQDATIKIWNLADGSLLKTMKGHTSFVNSLAISSDGLKLVSGSSDSMIYLWSAIDGGYLDTFKGHLSGVKSVTISSDGTKILSGSDDFAVRLWNLTDGRFIRAFYGHASAVTSVSFSSDEKEATSGSSDGTIKIWNIARGRLVRTISAFFNGINCILITPNGANIVSAGYDYDQNVWSYLYTIKIWDYYNGTLLQTLNGHTFVINSIAITPNGANIVSAGYDRDQNSWNYVYSIKIWNYSNGTLIYFLTGHTSRINTVAVTPDGSKIVSGSSDSTIKIWNLSDGSLNKTLSGSTSDVMTLIIKSDGSAIISASSDYTIKFWDLGTRYISPSASKSDRPLNSYSKGHSNSNTNTQSNTYSNSHTNAQSKTYSKEKSLSNTRFNTYSNTNSKTRSIKNSKKESQTRTRISNKPSGQHSSSHSRSKVLSTLTSPLPSKESITTLLSTSKSEQMGFQVAFMNQLAILSVPYCVNVTNSCDGGFLLTYQQIDVKWMFHKKLRNPYLNSDVKFGSVLEIFADIMAVSAPDSSYKNSPAGIVGIFKWNAQTKLFNRIISLRPMKTSKNEGFGKSITMQLDLIAVGSPNFSSVDALNSGCVYIFRNNTEKRWNRVPTIIKSPLRVADEFFGSAISFKNTETIAVANRPSVASLQTVYVFELDKDKWILSFTISDKSKLGFGWRIMFIQNLLYVSAPNDGTILPNAGSINVYNLKTFGQFELVNTIKPTQTIINEKFGFSFDTDGVKLIVGAKSCDEGQLCGTKGAAYVFSKSKTDWIEQRRFDNGLGDGSDGFGFDVAIKGASLLVSAPFDSAKGIRKGAVYFLKN